ncbi:MAG: enolase [Pseudanabaenales cyanobacterium]|nr:enolase [Pseudanabaenales cyanobacterium]
MSTPVRIVEATLFALRIPFVEAFAHSIQSRTYSDSIVVRLRADNGAVGYGEAVARPYVTGETVETCLQFMGETLWPSVQATANSLWEEQAPLAWLNQLAGTLPQGVKTDAVLAWNAARCGFELALADCLLKGQGISLAALFPPRRSTVTYSGVITASSVEGAVKHAKRFKQFALPHLKVKVTGEGDRERIAAIRSVVGPEVSLRIDGNGAYRVETAIATLQALAKFDIDSAEQMIPQGHPQQLAAVQAASPIPQMADESLITLADVQSLIEAHACNFFNLRLSKCGGLAQTLAIATQAQAAGIKIQVGCQVGETAILSAAGRHLAAYLPEVAFCEGSYGTLLLSEDLNRQPIHFGHRGLAKTLRGPGLGVDIQDRVLEKYAHQIISLPQSQ